MATRLQVLIPIAAAAVIVGIIGMLSIPDDAKLESVEFPRGTIKLDGKILEVQIADTQPRKTRGLMFQEQLPYDEGMIFVFDSPGIYSLWMLNMQFPLDMIWFNENGEVVHIEQDVPPGKKLQKIGFIMLWVPEPTGVTCAIGGPMILAGRYLDKKYNGATISDIGNQTKKTAAEIAHFKNTIM